MSKLTREEFRVLRTRAEHDLAQSREVPSILICAGTGCIAGGAMKIYDNFRSECEARGLKVYVGLKHDSDEEKSLHVKMSGCHGFCEMGPLVHIEPMGVMYIHVKPEDCHEILEKTVLGGEVIDRLVYHLDGTAYPKQEDIPFYKKQHRVVLENCGTSDAEDIEEYIAKGGYSSDGSTMIDLYAMTQEQYDAVLALIDSTTTFVDYDQNVLDIISDEAAGYFAGSKTVEEASKLIQSRVSLYIQEQK